MRKEKCMELSSDELLDELQKLSEDTRMRLMVMCEKEVRNPGPELTRLRKCACDHLENLQLWERTRKLLKGE